MLFSSLCIIVRWVLNRLFWRSFIDVVIYCSKQILSRHFFIMYYYLYTNCKFNILIFFIFYIFYSRRTYRLTYLSVFCFFLQFYYSTFYFTICHENIFYRALQSELIWLSDSRSLILFLMLLAEQKDKGDLKFQYLTQFAYDTKPAFIIYNNFCGRVFLFNLK